MKLVPDGVTRSIARQMLIAKKNSPHIFFVGGIAGVIGSTVLACRATLKLEDTLEDIEKDVKGVKELRDISDQNDLTYTQNDYYKDLGRVYLKSAGQLGKLYGPSIIVGGVSIAALTGSHIQMTRRNSALAAAFATISKAFEQYRERVTEEVGEERERDIYRGVREVETEDEKGKKTTKVVDPNATSPYAHCFDEVNVNWKPNAELNKIFLNCQQRYWNQHLQTHGYVILNDVLHALGFERTSAGAVVGWVRDSDKDGYIDFGLYDGCAAEFMNGQEHSVWLDFNVDGVIYDMIDKI